MQKYSIKEQIIMTYMGLEDPGIITSHNRDFSVGDIVQSDSGQTYEILFLPDEYSKCDDNLCILSDLSRENSLKYVNTEQLFSDLAKPEKIYQKYRFEKVTQVISSIF